jgi:Domain of unknown function (DUF4337)
MAELEIHHEGAEEIDEFGKRIGAMAAVIAILLAVVTISSHRSHTGAVVAKTEANDQWSFYQSKRTRLHNYELGKDMLHLMAPKGEETEAVLGKYEKEIKRYEKECEEIQEKAKEFENESKLEEQQALRFDLGEGFLELGLVLSSLYFLSKKKLFPLVGIIAAILGCVVGASGFLLK